MGTRKWTFSTIVVLLSAAVMIAALFLPYASALPAFRQMLEQLPAGENLESLGITAQSAVRISVAEFIGIYLSSNKMLGGYYCLLAVAMGITAVLSGLFAWLRRPVAVIACDLLAVAVLILQDCSYANRGVVPGTAYRFGIAYYLFYTAAVAVLTGAFLMIREHKNQK